LTPPVASATAAATTAVPALLIEGVNKAFVIGRKRPPVVAISDVWMRLERGDVHGILGANGSGSRTSSASSAGCSRRQRSSRGPATTSSARRWRSATDQSGQRDAASRAQSAENLPSPPGCTGSTGRCQAPCDRDPRPAWYQREAGSRPG
jgi:ABC-type glutathione transport system ATPase component